MQKHLSLALILASAMAVTTLAVAAPGGQAGGPHGGRHGHEHGQMMAFGKLNLTDAQRASIKQIVHASFSANKGQWKALHQQREAFDSMTPDQVGYQAAAASLAQAEGSAMQARVQQRANVRAQIYAVLNPTQKAQLATMQTQREARRQQWQQFKAQHPLPSTAQ
jgi:P pilus assembly/Cpx signaling pathway, periplasmic inhibitor/zinc-resistance associated protein